MTSFVEWLANQKSKFDHALIAKAKQQLADCTAECVFMTRDEIVGLHQMAGAYVSTRCGRHGRIKPHQLAELLLLIDQNILRHVTRKLTL